MPKGFSEKESIFFRNKLIDVGSELFGRSGLSKVTVDQIVKEVGISKGSFYKFFKNKEDLCFDALMKLEKDTRINIERDYKVYKDDPGNLIKMLLKGIPEIIEKYPLINIFKNPSDLQSLMLKVDPEKHNQNFEGDSLFLGRLLDGSNITDSEKNSLTGLMWVLVFMSFNQNFFNGQFLNIVELIGDMAKSHFGIGEKEKV